MNDSRRKSIDRDAAAYWWLEHGPAREVYFDSAKQAWIISRYADVSAALHETGLWLVGPDNKATPAPEERETQAHNRVETAARLPAAKVLEWKRAGEQDLSGMIAALPESGLVDVVGEVARPFGLALACLVGDIDARDAAKLESLAVTISTSTASPERVELKALAEKAGKELDDAFASIKASPVAQASFVALSQTLPALLGNSWLLLLGYPDAMAHLRADSKLIPKAVEELLRMVGLARVLHRRAIADLELGAVKIRTGERVDLLVASANYDPAQFAEPKQFDLTRKNSGHFALGAGHHSCAGAALIRMAVSVGTAAFVENFAPGADNSFIEWIGGSSFRWPKQIWAVRR